METFVVGSATHDPGIGAPVDAVFWLSGVTEIGVALITRRSGELEGAHEREREFVADEWNHGLEVGGRDVAVAVGVGVGRETEEVVALGVEAGAGGIQAGVGRTIIVIGLVPELAAESAADGVATPKREHITGSADVAATEFGDAVADKFRPERRGNAVGIFIVAGGDERAVLHGEGAGERIKRLGRIGLVDGGDQSRFAAGAGFIFDHAGGRIKQRSFPRPGTAQFAAKADDTAINGGVDVIGARGEIGESLVGD